jgi:hypothetical protein
MPKRSYFVSNLLTKSVLNSAMDAPSRDPRVLVFPHSHDFPTCTLQAQVGISITAVVVSEFGTPELCVGLRRGRMQWTTVPEATVHENRNARAPEGDVHLPSHSGHDRTVNAKPQPHAMELGTQSHLGLGVRAPSRLHSPQSLCRGRRGDTMSRTDVS